MQGAGRGKVLPGALTGALVHAGGDSDVVDVGSRCSVEKHRSMQSRVVEEVKVCVLHKVTLRVPRMGEECLTTDLLWSFDLSWNICPASQSQGLTSAKATQPLVGRPMGGVVSGVERGAGCCSLGGIRPVEDGPWRQRVGGECVVDGNGNAAGGQGPTLDQLADVSFEGEMPPLMLHHMHPIHPLQTQGDMGGRNKSVPAISGTPRTKGSMWGLRAPPTAA